MPNNIDPNKILEYLKTNPMLSPKHCSNCGSSHSSADLKLIGVNQGEISLQLSCSSCGLVQVVRMSPGGPMTIQRFESNNSDINPQELPKFAGKPAVSKDEALEVYSELKDIKGINELLGLISPD